MGKPATAYLVLLIIATLAVIIKPYNGIGDEIFYMALVRHDHNQAAVYTELKRSVPSKVYEALIGASGAPDCLSNDPMSVNRRNTATNSDYFFQLMPYFAVKPLYIAAAWLLRKIGVPLFAATHTVSAISFFMIGWIIWLWLSRYLFGWTTFAAASALTLQPFLVQTARSPLPDALGAFLLVTGAYLIWEQKRRTLGAGLLLLSILARPDALIFCVLFFALTWMLIPLLAAIVVYLTANHLAHAYSWATLFYVTFVHPLLDPKHTVVHIGPVLYLKVLAMNSLYVLGSNTPVILVLAVGIWVMAFYRSQRYFVLVCLVTILLHQLAFPTNSEFNANRFFSPEYLLIMLIGASMVLGDRSVQQHDHERGV